MKAKAVALGIPVWWEIPGDGRRPAIVSHIDARDVWVSFTDKPGGQKKTTAAQLEPRQARS